jgi:hypothetical protein
MAKIVAFSENEKTKQKWYTLEGGQKIETDEEIIDKLWNKWIMVTEEEQKTHVDGLTVYQFPEVFEINI